MISDHRKTQTDTRTVSRLLVMTVVWGFALGLALAAASTTFNSLLRFEPLQLLSYTIVPNAVCTGERTGIEGTMSITKPTLGNIHTITTHSRWVRLGSDERLTGEIDEQPFDGQYGMRSFSSDFARFAPPEPGLWAIEVYWTLDGTQALREAGQRTETYQTDAVVVSACPD